MTTGENIDNVQVDEDVTTTSDEVFQRVRSDEKMIDEGDGGYLKQNTAGLVQEIPNISFLDIADTMLESKKTFHNRQNWNIVVGANGKSVEAQPQDMAMLTYNNTRYDASDYDYTVPFDTITAPSGNLTTYSMVNSKIKISVPGVYRVSYGWVINPGGGTEIRVGIYKNSSTYITSDYFASTSALPYSRLSGGKTSFIECVAGDTLELYVSSDVNTTSVYGYNDTYLEVQYAQQSI